MCDPLTIAGIALTAGSTVANNAAANRQARAQASAMSAERSRQRMLDDESRGVNQQALGRFDNIGEQQQAKAAELTEQFSGEANRGADLISAILPQSSSNITNDNDAREREKATGFADQQGEAMARMRSFSDMFGGLGRDTAQDASQLGMLGGFKRGSQGVLPFELESAAMKGQGLRTAADLMGGLGSIGLTAGLSGAKMPSIFGGASAATAGGAPATSLRPMPRPANLAGLY
jgi:hypothetical protein